MILASDFPTSASGATVTANDFGWRRCASSILSVNSNHQAEVTVPADSRASITLKPKKENNPAIAFELLFFYFFFFYLYLAFHFYLPRIDFISSFYNYILFRTRVFYGTRCHTFIGPLG